jgi:hypothetical protein
MTVTFDYKNYSHVFENTSFPDRSFFQETDTFRKSLDGILFIDRVLTALGVAKGEPSTSRPSSTRFLAKLTVV